MWKINNALTETINNTIGVFQGSPLSAQLFIIYADYVMNEYKHNLGKTTCEKQKSKLET